MQWEGEWEAYLGVDFAIRSALGVGGVYLVEPFFREEVNVDKLDAGFDVAGEEQSVTVLDIPQYGRYVAYLTIVFRPVIYIMTHEYLSECSNCMRKIRKPTGGTFVHGCPPGVVTASNSEIILSGILHASS